MSFRPEEVSAVLAQELDRYEATLETKSVGTVLQVGDGIARVWGLEDAMAGELLEFPGDVMGLVLNLEEDNVGVVLFGSDENIKEGDRVERTGRIASVPVGPAHDRPRGERAGPAARRQGPDRHRPLPQPRVDRARA